MKTLSHLLLGTLLFSLIHVGCLSNSQPSSTGSSELSIGGISLKTPSDSLRNFWSAQQEGDFQARAAHIIAHFASPKSYGNGFGENEKQAYPRAMFDFLSGNRERAIAFLQAEDPQSERHAHTQGIDYYYSFTLKGQIRKYFLLGQFLDPDYRQRMFEGAKKWTEKDPLTQPHPIYGMGDGSGRDWDISRRGRWVDARNTDNLRAMRETSVYLMAEETDNEATRQRYKKKLQRYVSALYHIGMGEWDSVAYHSHTFAPYLNLYDFAQDPEVKSLAKAALDWMAAAAAVKYYQGGWGGPVKRDYGGANTAMGASAARSFWLYFGGSPLANDNPELDTLHFITSSYRPPQAVVALAQKQFQKPLELLSSKPVYETWKPGNAEAPGYWETQFFGNTFQMGTVASAFAAGDVAPFKLLADNSSRGVDFFLANTGKRWARQGKNPGDQIGQYQNLLIWLRPVDNKPFFFQFPQSAIVEIEPDHWFIRLEKTWLAIFPINLTHCHTIEINNKRYQSNYSQEQTCKAMPQGDYFAGFALEVGEARSHKTYEKFKSSIRDRSHLQLNGLSTGQIEFQGSGGQRLAFEYNFQNLLPNLKRDGKPHQWTEQFALYDSQTINGAPIALGWKQGNLQVRAGGFFFESRVPDYLSAQ